MHDPPGPLAERRLENETVAAPDATAAIRKCPFRERPIGSDPTAVEELLCRTGFFNPEEVRIGRELIEETLEGRATDYRFLFADADPESSSAAGLLGYACFGPIPLTHSSWDLYWIAVDPARQARGLGRALLAASEERAAALGAGRFFVDTSGRSQYLPTRRFYEANGYEVAARLGDFYAPGDDKVVYHKVLGTRQQP